MYKVRITFSKKSYAKYVSHLDLMRMFQRAMKRADIDISYSQGFNPHPRMSIGHPLPVGVTGESEYMDILVDSEPDYGQIKESLNNALPRDIRVTAVGEAVRPLNELVWAQYDVEIEVHKELKELQAYLEALRNKADIVVSKRTKKGISNVDIKPDIKEIKLVSQERNIYRFRMILSCAEGHNLKAASVLDAFRKYIPDFEVDNVTIHRSGLYCENMEVIS